MAEKIVARGKMFELVHNEQPDGRVFEVARRAPGVRLIIEDTMNRILLTKEYRHELEDWDYRLPGGKVFDSLEEYDEFRMSGSDILVPAKEKAIAEGREEAGLQIDTLKFYKKSTLGATVEWDLFVFAITKWHALEGGQELEVGERIEADGWFTHEQVENMILAGEMHEERIALVLLQWMKTAIGAKQ